MTQAAGPDLDKRRSAAAHPAGRQVHRAVLAAFAETGQAPARDVLERLAAGPVPTRPRYWPNSPTVM